MASRRPRQLSRRRRRAVAPMMILAFAGIGFMAYRRRNNSPRGLIRSPCPRSPHRDRLSGGLFCLTIAFAIATRYSRV
jgi:hypothetical protein